MENTEQLLEILQAVCNRTAERHGLHRLIELTQSFASTYLRHRYKNLGRILTARDITLNEMAVDAIAPLFERDESGDFIRIKKAFERWEPKIESGEQAVFFINRLAAKSAEKYVSELLKESDPFFSKILRSVNYIIKNNGYRKKRLVGTTYIMRKDDPDISRLPSAQFIYDLPAQLFIKKNVVLEELFAYISENTDRVEAVPLNALIIKIKKTGFTEWNPESGTEFSTELEIKSVVNKAVITAFEKLERSYLDKSKISKNESEAVKKALQKIADDLQDGGINTGLHKYLIAEIAGLSFEDYRMKYQNMFEYLYKVLKKEIIDQIEN